MKSFHFSLQKILDLKEKNREQEEWNFARIAKQLKDENEKLQSNITNKNVLHEELLNDQAKGIPIVEINSIQAYLNYLDKLIHHQKVNLRQIENSLLAKQQELVELKIEEKKWIKLREKKFEEFNYKNNQLEQKEMDEIAIQRMFK